MAISQENLSSDAPGDVTQLLLAWSAGEVAAGDRLMALVYEELRRLARRQLRGQRQDHSLRTTDLLHEAYLRLVRQTDVEWKNRAHFYGVAAMMMRRVLVDAARARRSGKREGRWMRLSLEDIGGTVEISPERVEELLALDEALTRLQVLSPEQVRVVELRFFVGFSNEEAADILALSPRTVSRYWEAARLWLYRELTDSQPSPG